MGMHTVLLQSNNSYLSSNGFLHTIFKGLRKYTRSTNIEWLRLTCYVFRLELSEMLPLDCNHTHIIFVYKYSRILCKKI